MTISIIIPTKGRPSLARTLLSIKPQISPDDEVVTVSDGPQPAARDIVAAMGPPFRFIHGPTTNQWGHAQRTIGMMAANGNYLAFMDDDDIYLPGALDAMRKAIAETDGGLILFRMKHHEDVFWRKPRIWLGNVSTQMILLQNDPSRFGEWKPHPTMPKGQGGDYIFISETASKWPREKIVFREEVIAQLTQHNWGA